jgi:hypothetical protein
MHDSDEGVKGLGEKTGINIYIESTFFLLSSSCSKERRCFFFAFVSAALYPLAFTAFFSTTPI